MELIILIGILLVVWFFASNKDAFSSFVSFLKIQFNKLKDFIIDYINR